MSAQADERVFVLYDGMAGYGAESTLERPTDDACERRFVAEGVSKLKITRFFGGRGATPPEVPRGLYSAFWPAAFCAHPNRCAFWHSLGRKRRITARLGER